MRGRRSPAALDLFLGSVLLLCAGWAVAANAACSALRVNHAWVRAPLPGVSVLAGYLDVTNSGDSMVRLTAVSSPQFERIQLHHSMTNAQGMESMRPVTGVKIAPGTTFAFAPGGYHLMMFDPVKPLAVGDKVTLTLHCGGAQAPPVTAEVRSMLPGHAGHDASSQGGGG